MLEVGCGDICSRSCRTQREERSEQRPGVARHAEDTPGPAALSLHGAGDLTALQQSVGNGAVARLVQSKMEVGAADDAHRPRGRPGGQPGRGSDRRKPGSNPGADPSRGAHPPGGDRRASSGTGPRCWPGRGRRGGRGGGLGRPRRRRGAPRCRGCHRRRDRRPAPGGQHPDADGAGIRGVVRPRPVAHGRRRRPDCRHLGAKAFTTGSDVFLGRDAVHTDGHAVPRVLAPAHSCRPADRSWDWWVFDDRSRAADASLGDREGELRQGVEERRQVVRPYPGGHQYLQPGARRSRRLLPLHRRHADRAGTSAPPPPR